MDPRTAATGFLGTGASLAADIALLAYIFLIVPGMLVGFAFARRHKFVPHHKLMMTAVVVINWIIIFYLMAVSYSRTVAANIPQGLNQPFFLSPTIHLVLGLTAQIIGTILVLRMWLENVLPRSLRFEPIKPWMRLTLGLWLVTATLGVVTYYIWYGLPFSGGRGAAPGETNPAATQPADLNVKNSTAPLTVPLKGFLFVPADLTVPVGTAIRFINKDSAPHTVTYTDDSVDTGNFFKGDFRDLKFDKAGDIKLYCKLHGANDGTGMAMVVHVKPASEVAAAPTTDKAALTAIPPTAAPSAPPPPKPPLQQQVKNQLVGIVAFADFTSFSDTVNVQLINLEQPPSGKVYYGWLVGSNDRWLSVGKIETDDKGAANIHQSFARRNLVADFDSFVITAENPTGTPKQPGEVYYTGKEPPEAYAQIRRIVGKADGTPNLFGYAVGARLQVDEMIRQAALIQDLMKAGNLEEAKAHGEAIVNVSKGGAGEDLDGDKSVVQPGDDYGLRKYIQGASDAANAAETAKDATGAVKLHSEHVKIAAQNALAVLDDLEKQANALIAAKSFGDARQPAASLQDLALKLRDGVDKDNDGTIDPVPGEGAIFTMYDHAQYIAAMAVVSGNGQQPTALATQAAPTAVPTQAQPTGTQAVSPTQTPAPEETLPATEGAVQLTDSSQVTVKMLDFEFDKPSIVVKVGTEVTWVNTGAGPRHSAKADDDSFNTDLYGPGKSKTIKFDKPGTFPYYCELHGDKGGQGMAGVVKVVP